MVLYPAATSVDSPLAHMVAHPLLLALVVLFHPPTGANIAHVLGQLALCGGIYSASYIYIYICSALSVQYGSNTARGPRARSEALRASAVFEAISHTKHTIITRRKHSIVGRAS